MTRSAHTTPGTMRRERAWAWAWVWVWVWAVGVGLADAQYQWQPFADFDGPYCRTRYPEQCCRSRYDPCAVPIDGTLCYCDDFCVRPTGSDCCPDYFEVCRGVPRPTPPPRPEPIRVCVTDDGRQVPYNYEYKDNCNLCKCQEGRIECEQDVCMVEEDLINRVNRRPRVGWRASNYSMFWGRKALEGFTYRTGTHSPETLSMRMYPILLRPDFIPREFDARTKWEWRNLISGVGDQGWCGASWAFSTLGVAQDRIAIETAGNETAILSAQHLLSCDRHGQSGCRGGHVEYAWQFLRRIGTVDESCFPYRSGATGNVPSCPRGRTRRSVRCASNRIQYRDDFYFVEPSYRISGKEEDIQWEIMQNGPVQAIMNVHRDFFMYREGIYTHTGMEGAQGGGPALHSVRILGWGEDNSVKYWLCANSWGREWGENGYFRIRRGTNESDIETFILSVRANFNSGKLGAHRRGLRNRRRGRGNRRTRNHPNSLHSNQHQHGNKW